MLPDLGQTFIFSGMALVLTASLIFLTGMYPRQARVQRMQGAAGMALVSLCGITAAMLLAALVCTALSVQWPFLIIGGGLGFLVAPMIYQILPVSLVEGPAGAALLIAANALLAMQAVPKAVLPPL